MAILSLRSPRQRSSVIVQYSTKSQAQVLSVCSLKVIVHRAGRESPSPFVGDIDLLFVSLNNSDTEFLSSDCAGMQGRSTFLRPLRLDATVVLSEVSALLKRSRWKCQRAGLWHFITNAFKGFASVTMTSCYDIMSFQISGYTQIRATVPVSYSVQKA